MDVKEVIEAIASGIATLSSKVFDEKVQRRLGGDSPWDYIEHHKVLSANGTSGGARHRARA